MLIDTHAHLYWDSYKDDLDQVIQRAQDAGVSIIINVGVDIEKSKKALRQTQEELANIPGLNTYSTIGIHPHEALNYAQSGQMSPDPLRLVGDEASRSTNILEDIALLERIYNNNPTKIVAVGECGLDYKEVDEQTKQLQRQLFQAQIDLAKKLNLPLIVHCRDDRSQNPENSEAWDEVLDLVDNHPTILHCYSGLSQTTQKVLVMPNTVISFAGTITYPKNDYLREAVKLLPLEKIVLETDCPFLPPQSKRGQRNEPANVLAIAQLIAEEKGISLKEIRIQTTENVKKLLKLT